LDTTGFYTFFLNLILVMLWTHNPPYFSPESFCRGVVGVLQVSGAGAAVVELLAASYCHWFRI